jgi:hypothetical protein
MSGENEAAGAVPGRIGEAAPYVTTVEESPIPRGGQLADWVRFGVMFWQVILGSLLLVAGAIAIFFGWWGVAGTNLVLVQLTYLASGGIAGLAMVVTGAVLLLSFQIARQNALLKRAILLGDRGMAVGETASVKKPPTAALPPDEGEVVVPRGARTYHRASRVYAVGKSVTAYPVGLAALKDFKACRACDPPGCDTDTAGTTSSGPRA